MNSRFVTVDESVDVATAVKQMNQEKAEVIIVRRQGIPIGIVTDSDVINNVVMKGEESDKVRIGAIMSTPLQTLSYKASVSQALQSMRVNKIVRVPVVDSSGIIGLVNQHALANAIRTSVLEKAFHSYRGALGDEYKPVLGNLGIILQFSAILLVVPAFLGLIIGEGASTVGIFLAVIGLSFTGFFLMSYGERAPMNIKQVSILVVLSFIVLSLFGAIPYAYANPFWPGIDGQSLFVNSFFESSSGFTTTGLTLIAAPENLPHSLSFYRSYTQWVGGLSFVYLIVTLFYPEKKLGSMKSLFGGEMLGFKQFLLTLVVIFSLYTILLSFLVVYLTDLHDLDAIALVLSTITGGGFSPVSNAVSPSNAATLGILSIGMVLSALPFAFHYYTFYRGGRMVGRTVGLEVRVYLALVCVSVPLLYLLSYTSMQVDWLSAAFHAISASTTTGFQYLDIGATGDGAMTYLILLMLVGGTAFSTAGGIKIGRFVALYQEYRRRRLAQAESRGVQAASEEPAFDPTMTSISAVWSQDSRPNLLARIKEEYESRPELVEIVHEQGERIRVIRAMLRVKSVREILIVIGLYVFIPLLTACFVSYLANTSYERALFESVSAITTTGLSAGVTNLNLDLVSKLLLAANMIVGRLEIMVIFYIFFKSLRR